MKNSTIEKLHGEFKEQYQHEEIRKNQLSDETNKQVGLVSVLFGALFYISAKIALPLSCVDIITLTLLILAVIPLLASVFFLIKSVIGFTYKYVAGPGKLKEYYSKLIEYHDGKIEKAVMSVLEEIHSSYAAAADKNLENNDQKSECLYKSRRAIVLSVPIIISLGFFIAISNIFDHNKRSVQPKVNLLENTKMSDDDKPKQPPPEKEPPKAPPLRDVREGIETPKRKIR